MPPTGRISFLWVLLIQLLLVSSSSSQNILSPRPGDCRRSIVRQEWRTLSKPEQLHYIQSVQCAMRRPGITPSTVASGVVSRYDDLVATHIIQAYSIHIVGHFLPWHRLFTAYYERMLRDECGYRGAQPYWDWTLDVPAAKFVKSPVFDPVYGFGGNGPFIPYNFTEGEIYSRSGGGCVSNGPFKNMTVHLGPANNTARNDQCLRRDFAPEYGAWTLTREKVDRVLSQSNFGWFTAWVERAAFDNTSQFHTGGHMSVGGNYGQMADGSASPADPIFWLHHANIDRIWWTWQKKDLETRLKDISGSIYLGDYLNQQGGNVTLDFPISLGANNWNAKIADVMDIRPLCYTYDKLY